MAKRSAVKPMFALSPVAFRNSAIAGRGVFARRRFQPGEVVVAYAPKQRKVDANAAEAAVAAESKLTLLSGGDVIIPDESTPGGWLCNHSCDPNATLYASGEGRIQCRRAIAPGEEVTIFYGWVSQDDPKRDPCRCGSATCRGFINFDVKTADLAEVVLDETGGFTPGVALGRRFADYETFLRSIGQEQVMQAIAYTLTRMRRRATGAS